MRSTIGPALVLLGLVVAWEILHLVVANSGLPSPFETLAQLGVLFQDADFWKETAQTAQAFAIAVVISTIAGITLGILLGMNRTAGAVSEPILVNLYALPKVTLYPVVLLLFGLGISARIAFGVMHGMIPLTLFTMNAILQLKPVYRRSAAVMGLSSFDTSIRVVLPAILPEVITGTRLGFSLCLLGVLIGEMFASRNGLGYLVTHAMERGDMPTVLAVAVLLAVFALLANAALLALDRSRRH
ncbi:binding-protein-dependent transport systems inner membrane component [Rhodovulum sp. PH10]|uniref:ABC transporter permease n=1 Tax=Rhodovulum sp. PH10 TaxID=1187851 RepID=UPI00027C2B55|nr:ABC transporter permease subunit [Rhodovulum sp. PH10]EJW11728.1 binding-protein-dependent transport systems inner membrane component [Rhodovulum sp. PH10]